MKKTTRFFLSVLFITAVYVACGPQSQTAEIEGMEFDSVVVDSVARLLDIPDAPTCELSLSIQYAKGGKAELINDTLLRSGILTPDYLSLDQQKLTVKESVDSFVCRYITDYLKDYRELYVADRDHGASYNCIYKVKTRTRSNNKNVLNYIAEIFSYGGGAHGIKQTLVRNFDVKTGHLITLDDIFVSGYEDAMKAKIVEKMSSKFKVKDLQALQEKYIFADSHVYVPENFILEDKKIIFIYCEDEIAPHDVGEIRLTFYKGEISTYLK